MSTKALAGLIPALVCTASLPVHAQEPAPVAPAPAVQPAPAPEVAPAPPPPELAAPPAVVAEPVPVEPPPEEPPAVPAPSPISVNAWMHLSFSLQGAEERDSFDNLIIDLGELDLLVNGDITENIGITADLVGTINGTGGGFGNVGILDLIGRFKIHDAFNIWVGRMLVPSDRSNFSGFWFANPWYYPGFFVPGAAPFGPQQGPFGRNDGATVWGQFGGGLFKYYLGIYELTEPAQPLLFSARLNLSLLSPEPGYYHNATYLGEKDILAIGVGFQYEKDAAPPDDYTEFNADLLFEKTFGEGGMISFMGEFYLPMGDGNTLDNQFTVELSYLTGKPVGFGKIQPLVRLQMANPKSDIYDTWTLVDAQLGYVISGFAARLALGYQFADTPPGTDMMGAPLAMNVSGHSIYLGIQLQK